MVDGDSSSQMLSNGDDDENFNVHFLAEVQLYCNTSNNA